MKRTAGWLTIVCLGLSVAIIGIWTRSAASQDPDLESNFGSVKLKHGFEPDPYVKELTAGGNLHINKGGVKAWMTKQPDFNLHYEAGDYALTIYVESKTDTTLLINLPDGKWVANDDGPGTGLNPLIHFKKPQSGRYDIWVGCVEKFEAKKAKLKITERK